jgi:hypothetical protein
MPLFRREVAFAPAPVYSRPPRDDEEYVMKAFARHAAHCSACADPYLVHREGGTLCAKGHQRALDVAQYVYHKAGQAYSTVDREGYRSVQVEIPVHYDAVRSLLRAMERGLRLQKGAVASYDKTYLVPVRPSLPARQPCLETVVPPSDLRRAALARRDGRGGLYAEEMAARERAAAVKPTVYYRPTPEVRNVAPRRFS